MLVYKKGFFSFIFEHKRMSQEILQIVLAFFSLAFFEEDKRKIQVIWKESAKKK